MGNSWMIFEIEQFRHSYLFEVEVEANITSGGSNRWGSDEPEWVEVEILNMYNTKTGKKISNRLYSALEKQYGDWMEESFIEENSYGL
jgi:hypothetical protein